MRLNMVGAFIRNSPFGSEIAFKKGLERLGHAVTPIDPDYPGQTWDHGADATIVFKWLPAYQEELAKCSGHKIVYQPDDLRFPHIRDMMLKMREHCDHALTFDDDGARLALSYGYKTAKRLLLTADDTLYRPSNVPKIIDLCFVGSLTMGPNHASRRRMIEVIREKTKLRIAVANELFDVPYIAKLYSYSRVVLNHATDVGQPFGHGYGYQCRHFEAGMTRSCVLSNVVDNESVIRHIETFSDERELVEKAQQLVRDDVMRQKLADGLYAEILESHMPQHRGQEIVDFVERLG